MRRRIVAGNWKMNNNLQEGIALANEVLADMGNLSKEVELVLIPSFIHLFHVHELVRNKEGISLGAQDVSAQEKGAFTGEVSPSMLRSCGVKYVLVGHSERRSYHAESDAVVAKKLQNAIQNGLFPILCVGEELKERYAKRQNQIVKNQLNLSLENISNDEMARVVIAYEPVWAIGTGETASAEQAQDMHAHIRECILELFGQKVAEQTPILYGGSCNPTNAAELFDQADVDGGLIGGASLKADDFLTIARAFE